MVYKLTGCFLVSSGRPHPKIPLHCGCPWWWWLITLPSGVWQLLCPEIWHHIIFSCKPAHPVQPHRDLDWLGAVHHGGAALSYLWDVMRNSGNSSWSAQLDSILMFCFKRWGCNSIATSSVTKMVDKTRLTSLGVDPLQGCPDLFLENHFPVNLLPQLNTPEPGNQSDQT